ncbi:MAG: HEAT repeat domain-containing protein [Promethearchaeota archaeon]
MNDVEREAIEITQIKDFVNDGRFDDAVQTIGLYIGDADEKDYLDRLENVIETLLTLHGGRTVIRFLMENLIIDLPSLLENLSKKDSVLRYTFLLLIKTICEKECDLFLPYSEDLLNSEDPNVREAALQIIIYMVSGEAIIDDEALIKVIIMKLSDEKDFVIEKAIQALKTIGEKTPKLVTKILTDYAKEVSEIPEKEEIIDYIDQILKSIVSVDKIEEIVEEETVKKEFPEREVEPSKIMSKEESEILDKEFELKKKELEIKKKKLELKEKEKQIEEKVIQKKEEVLKLKEEILEKESDIGEDIEKKIPKKLKKKEEKIIDKELELKKKDLEIKKKKLELEEKEKELEEKEILEREKALKLKEKLMEQEKALSQVELELKQKSIEEKEKKIKEEEQKRIEETLKEVKNQDDIEKRD